MAMEFSTNSGDIARVPPRVEALQNGRLETSRGGALITPDAEVVAKIEEETAGKVSYFRTPDVEEFQESDARIVGDPEYAEFVMRPLINTLRERFPGRNLALRGVATSINGHLPPRGSGDFDLWDITEVAENGVEKPGDIFNVTRLGPEDDSINVHRTTQYAASVGFLRRWEMETPEKADATFPAILVYDGEALQPAGHNTYGVSFAEGSNPQDVLLGVYLLDCPGR